MFIVYEMSNFKVQMPNQNPKLEYQKILILNFDIHLTFGF